MADYKPTKRTNAGSNRSARNTVDEGLRKYSRRNAADYREQASSRRRKDDVAPRQTYTQNQTHGFRPEDIPVQTRPSARTQNTQVRDSRLSGIPSVGNQGAGSTGAFRPTRTTRQQQPVLNTNTIPRITNADTSQYSAENYRTRRMSNGGYAAAGATQLMPEEAHAVGAQSTNPYSRHNSDNPYSRNNGNPYSRNNYSRGGQPRDMEDEQEFDNRGHFEAMAGRRSRIPGGGKPAKPKTPMNLQKVVMGIIALVLVVAAGFGVKYLLEHGPVDVVLNGKEITLQDEQRSANAILDAKLVTVKAGNKLAVDNTVFQNGGGDRCFVTINDKEGVSADQRINNGDVITIANGKDTMEEYTDSNNQSFKKDFYFEGKGAIHLYEGENKDGVRTVRTGKESGKSVDTIQTDATARHLTFYNASTSEKIIALTFDDGPWPGTTEQILDTLKQNNAKATFFTIGKQIAGHESSIKRMMDEGHQICTHTYDHAEGSGQGVSLIKMSTQERRDEIEKGLKAISDVTGKPASKVIRAPGGNFNESVALDVIDLCDSEIGWNVDTEDWRRPGADVIAQRIMSAKPGDIILMHDGGGDRTQTAAALAQALPYLREQGYTFVTMDELIAKCGRVQGSY